MTKRIASVWVVIALLLGVSLAQTPSTETPNINGDWTGTWGIYSPAAILGMELFLYLQWFRGRIKLEYQ